MTGEHDESAGGLANIEHEALAWLVRERDGLDAAGQRALHAWLARSPRHREAYAAWAEDWQALEAVPIERRASLRAPVPATRARARACWPRRRFLVAGGLAGAAAWLAVNAAWPEAPDAAARSARYATAAGEFKPLVLPDGSHVELDTASVLSVTWDDARRELELPEGQAWFDIRPDVARPLHLLAGPARVRVLGTQFTVRHLPGSQSGAIEVVVLAGQVQVGKAATGSGWSRWFDRVGADEVALSAGQRLRLSADGRPGPVQAADPARVGLWREQRIALDDVTLADALAEFARYGHAVARVADARAANLRLTGIFDAGAPDRFYQVLPQVLPVVVRHEARGVVIASVG